MSEQSRKQVIQPTDVFNPHAVFGPGAYRQAIRVESTIFFAGQAAIGTDGTVIGVGDVTAQTVAVMDNLMACLRDAGASANDIVKVTTFYLNRDHLSEIAAVRSRYLAGIDYVHTGVIIAGLADPDLVLEIEAVAVIGSGS